MRLNKLLIVPIIVVFTSCGSGNDDPSDIGASIETFEMLEAVFDGPYSKYAIKDKLDEVFAVYNMEANQGNYLKAGNSLVDYRKDGNGSFREMDIINHMIEANTGEGGVSFNEQLNKSVRAMKKELAEK